MPFFTNSLRWAIPVPVEVLGANFDAYVELLPIINTLRLCNRFGPEASSGITQLPPEIIVEIEEYLIIEARQRHRFAWAEDFECFQMLCAPSHHVDDAQLGQLFDQAWDLVCDDDNVDEDNESEFGLKLDCRVDELLSEDLDMWMDTHVARVHSWQHRVGAKGTEHNRGFFSTHAHLFRQHFGLEVWISHVRLEDWPEHTHSHWSGVDYDAPDTTVAYLTLPGHPHQHKVIPLSTMEIEETTFYVQSGFAMPVKLPQSLSKQTLAKFKSAMARLGLRPSVADSQRDMGLAADSPESDKQGNKHSIKGDEKDDGKRDCDADGEETIEAGEAPIWPQLTMLTRCTVVFDVNL